MLAGSALLYQFIWVPGSLAKYLSYGYDWLASNRKQDNLPPLPDWGKRAKRAQNNYIENFPPFAIAVLALGILGEFNFYTSLATVVFFLSRVSHLIVYMIGWVYIRTISWFLGLLSTVYLYYWLLQVLITS